MQRIIFYVTLLGLLQIGCRINQYKNLLKHGRWVYKDTIGNKLYKYKGKYNSGIETGVWKYYWNKRLVRLEKYENGIGNVEFYHPNGTISSFGKTKADTTAEEIHWYYFGDWMYYDDKGKLIAKRTYEKGEIVKETEF